MDDLGKAATRRRRRNMFPTWDHLDGRCLLAGMSPAELTAAYGLNAITFRAANGSAVKGDGAGETIALIEAYHDPTLASDLHTYDQAYHLPNPTLTVDNLAEFSIDQGWGLEESLDVEIAHAIAPAANLLVVEASSATLGGLVAAVNLARNSPGVVAISMSWGFGEFRQEASYNNTFTTPGGHQGITFVAASGDSGPGAGPEWPSISPTVLAVGGTTLNVSSSGAYQSESAWNGSSGGYSRFIAEPEYQRSVQRTGRRSTPDVSFVGDPGTGVSVYQTSPLFGEGSWYVVGGTSVGAPAWAAMIAIADQGRAPGQGKPGRRDRYVTHSLCGISQRLEDRHAPETDQAHGNRHGQHGHWPRFACWPERDFRSRRQRSRGTAHLERERRAQAQSGPRAVAWLARRLRG